MFCLERRYCHKPVLEEYAEQAFGFASVTLLSFEDLFAGKICATLDRQHPRDLYDTYWLLQNEGINERLKDAFLVYLMSHIQTHIVKAVKTGLNQTACGRCIFKLNRILRSLKWAEEHDQILKLDHQLK